MTVSPGFQAALTPVPTTPSIWVASRPTPSTFNEGATVRLSIRCFNAVPGASKMIWKLSGSKANPANWSLPWDVAWNAAMKGRGMKYTGLPAGPNNATVAGLIEVDETYDGMPVELSITCLANRRTDVLGGNPGQLQVTLQLALPEGATGTLSGNGLPFFINDTSKTPAGTPTFRPQLLMPDGSPGSASINEGDSRVIQLSTENMVPGTTFLYAAVNKGQNKIAGGMKATVKAAAEAAGCLCDTSYGTRGNYNGGVITFTDQYDDAKPIRIPITITEDNVTTGTLQLDFQTHRWVDGDPDNPAQRFGGTITLNINDTSVEPTPSYWRILATVSAGVITYSLTSPTGTSDASVRLTSSASKPDGFDAALAAAIAGTPGLSIAGDVITSTSAWNGELSWSVAKPASAGKHSLRLAEPTAESLIVVGDACVYFLPPATPANPAYVTGLNLSGGEFGDRKPGTYGTDYRYPARPEQADPAQRHPEIDYHLGKGAGIIRLPVRWERIQDGPFGELRSPGTLATWSGSLDMDRIDEIISYVTARGRIVLLDVHNYMGWADQGKVGFDYALPTAALCDLWERLANRYANNPLVWFGLMNEPSGGQVTPARCRDIMDWVTQAIRGRTPALNRIFVAGTFYTGAWSWVGQGNAAAFVTYRDPAGNAAIELHQYFDTGSPGLSGVCNANAQNRLVEATNWARANGHKLFLGEFMGGDPTITGQEQCGSVVPAACAYLLANRDVWAGWTAWGGGGRWNATYIFRLDPIGGYGTASSDTRQFKMIEPYLTTIN